MVTDQLKIAVWCVALAAACTLALQTAFAQGKGVSLGDAPPALQISEWVNGPPIEQFQKGHIYVVEFSAVWCPPCINFVPHLSDLAKRYPEEVTVVSIFGLSLYDDDSTGQKYRDAVCNLVHEMKADIAYSVAVDNRSGATAKTWGIRGVPHAVVIGRDGQVAWAGNPAKGLDDALAALTSGAKDLTSLIDAQDALRSALKAMDSLFMRDSR